MNFRDFGIPVQTKWASPREDLVPLPRTLTGSLVREHPVVALEDFDGLELIGAAGSLEPETETPDWALPLISIYGHGGAALDLENVAGLKAPEEVAPADVDLFDLDPQLEPLLNATDGLRLSNLSRLTRVVRDWSEEAEQASGVYFTPISKAEPDANNPSFISFVHEAQHRLLQRKKDKDLWAWFLDWRQAALSLFDEGTDIDGDWLLKMLRLRRAAARRRVRRRRAPRHRAARAERLIRLARYIAPNAPPASLQTEPMPTEAA